METNGLDIFQMIERARTHGFLVVKVGSDGAVFTKGNLSVIYSEDKELDGKLWGHLSFARPNKYPPYDEIKYVKKAFFGDRKAIMVFPKEEEFVNIHKYCFHLFTCFTEDILPDFTRGSNNL